MNRSAAENDSVNDRFHALEQRIARLERLLELQGSGPVPEALAGPEPAAKPKRGEEEIEFELGQSWFARAGIVVLALGMVFLLTFPWAGLPSAIPGIVGLALAGSLFLAARVLRSSFDLVSRYLRGAGMVLLFFTILRLFYFGAGPALRADSAPGILLLVLVIAVNTALALRRGSPWLCSIAVFTGYAAALAVGAWWFALPVIFAMSVLAVVTVLRTSWNGVLILSTILACLGYLLWALNDPFVGNPIGFVTEPAGAAFLPLAVAVVFALGVLLRRERGREEPPVVAASFLNGAGCYGIFLIHTAAAFPESMVASHLAASAVLLGLATAFWIRERSRYSTFAYAMLGYAALSVAIIRAAEVPAVFVWLSIQSLVVVATAVWFRSRFIVVANFVIYVVIIAAYVAVGGKETGISIWYGVVALASARILNWRQDRLELKTGMMRNAYLASAFVAFPYATYHLVPTEYVSLSWVAIAGFYYMMNLLVRAQKYRWMGHLTLFLTVLYVLIIGIAQLEPAYRIMSFLVLGTVLLAGSLVFTRLRMKRRARGGEEPAGPAP